VAAAASRRGQRTASVRIRRVFTPDRRGLFVPVKPPQLGTAVDAAFGSGRQRVPDRIDIGRSPGAECVADGRKPHAEAAADHEPKSGPIRRLPPQQHAAPRLIHRVRARPAAWPPSSMAGSISVLPELKRIVARRQAVEAVC
jgi:hypothetical protein